VPGEINGIHQQGRFLQGNDAAWPQKTAAPYTFAWSNVAAGSYSADRQATDAQSNVTTSSAVNVTVVNPVPTVSITAPQSGATFNAPASISITASASEVNGTISKVDFYKGTHATGNKNRGTVYVRLEQCGSRPHIR